MVTFQLYSILMSKSSIANIMPMVSVTETQAVISVERVNVELAGETRQSDKKCIETAIVLASRPTS